MAYLTQYSGSVPVIKFNIDQSFMTIGQNIDMDICVPEDGISDNHAVLEAIHDNEKWQFVVKSRPDEPQLIFNGEAVSVAELHDGDWIMIGEVEFQFTDDGIYEITLVESPDLDTHPAVAPILELVSTEQKKLDVSKDLVEEFTANPSVLDDGQHEDKLIKTNTLQDDNRFSRRLNFF